MQPSEDVDQVTSLARRMAAHEEADVQRFGHLELRLGTVERQVARGAFLGVLVAEAVRAGAPEIGHVLLQILGAS